MSNEPIKLSFESIRADVPDACGFVYPKAELEKMVGDAQDKVRASARITSILGSTKVARNTVMKRVGGKTWNCVPRSLS